MDAASVVIGVLGVPTGVGLAYLLQRLSLTKLAVALSLLLWGVILLVVLLSGAALAGLVDLASVAWLYEYLPDGQGIAWNFLMAFLIGFPSYSFLAYRQSKENDQARRGRSPS